MKPIISPLTEAQVHAFIQWEYAGPYAMYNMSTEEEAEQIRFFLEPENGYFAITDQAGEFLGFCNFGDDARVPGGDYSVEAVDIGMGMRPDLTGQGQGALYAEAVFEFAQEWFPNLPQRVTVAEFNKRAQQLSSNFGFIQTSRFVRERDEKAFVIMVRDG